MILIQILATILAFMSSIGLVKGMRALDLMWGGVSAGTWGLIFTTSIFLCLFAAAENQEED